ncbi:type VI secretion system-associated FHA domain protein TagH [Jiella mangrovi]|uniref:Type VI secretion system-associated FHA domain protein TagH n=1 Tax=Jiella mangrovi TaxID=2821407 RepID=A0ABS4BGR0_9HYPH|nr:type VI secretion system-associated FHA domain protein TagH [Jiella mangrovi]MBP0615941.1 type VI secretion system-associated FHA domain protein TagH [Jiella mangrovi]
MRIDLVLENLDRLDNGGPVSFSATDRTFEIGREPPRDWVLPDPDRFVSSRHCEIRFEDGGFVLIDHSTNGTFVNGSDNRLPGPRRLESGDRLLIGQYHVTVQISATVGGWEDDEPRLATAGNAWREPPRPAAAIADASDPWSIDGPVPPPIELRPAPQPNPPAFGQEPIDFVLQGPGASPADAFRPAPTDWSDDAEARGSHGEPRAFEEYDQRFGSGGTEPSQPFDEEDDPFEINASPARAEPVRPAPSVAARRRRDEWSEREPRAAEQSTGAVRDVAHRPASMEADFTAQVTEPSSPREAERLLSAMAQAAGLDPTIFSGRPPEEVAREIGTLLSLVTGGVGELLRMRAKAKTVTRSGDRTTIEAMGNNALKFSPNPQGALAKMFGADGPGYLAPSESFEEAFNDLSQHELITFAAMQKALKRLIDDLSPEAITARLPSSVMPFSRKAQAWDLFVNRWDAKTEPFEHGMLDVFLQYFREIYDENARSRRR